MDQAAREALGRQERSSRPPRLAHRLSSSAVSTIIVSYTQRVHHTHRGHAHTHLLLALARNISRDRLEQPDAAEPVTESDEE